MEATQGHSAACCNIPPIISKGYHYKGKYETIGGMKTYITGPSTATKAIFFITDIFGYFPQALQGADILATSGDEKYLVFAPDLLDGNPADISWYPPGDDKEKQQKLGNWFGTTGVPTKAAGRIPDLVKVYGEKFGALEKWGIVGFCWGGKVVSLATSTDSTPFTAAAECHPAFVDPADAEKIKIPLCMLASKDEDAEAVKKFEATLQADKHVETFEDQIHGFMAARSDLEDERVKSEYERGYKTLVEFFAKHLK